MLLNSRNLFVYSYLILILGFYIGEDLNGNAKEDYLGQFHIIAEFSKNFIYALQNYAELEEGTSRQSPLFFGLLSIIYKIFPSGDLLRFVNFNICFISIFMFYKCLKLVYKQETSLNITLVSVILILSPSFRSLAIWPNSINLGLLFFIISIFFYLKFNLEKDSKIKFYNSLLNILFLSISSYISPNYSVFVIFFTYNFFRYFNLQKISLIILFNIILSFPAVYYVFIEENYFIFNHVISAEVDNTLNFSSIANKFSIIFSIIFFYLLPFLIFEKKLLIRIKKNFYIKILIILILTLFISFTFNYNYLVGGGGIFFKISNYFFSNNYLFYTIFGISLFFIYEIIYKNINNFILIFCLLISIPQYSIYHKYFDPLFIILWFLLFNKDSFNNYFKSKKNILALYAFYIIFIILNYLKSYI